MQSSEFPPATTSTFSPKVIVSNAGRQHVHQLLIGLNAHGHLQRFYTTFAFIKKSITGRLIQYLPQPLRKKAEKTLYKRHFPQIKREMIVQHPLPEICRELMDILLPINSEKWSFRIGIQHDKFTARKIKKEKFDMAIGYEMSSLHFFKTAKTLRKITILDLAQIHYQEISNIAKRYPYFAPLLNTPELRKAIDRVKDEELKYADYIFCLSTFAKDSLTKHGISPGKIFLVNVGFDPERFIPKKKYAQQGKFHILFAGTITARKGIHLLIEAFKSLALSDATLTLVGPVTDGKELLKEHADIIRYIPFLSHEELVSVYQEADLFVFPSYLDSWAMVVLEAMACGTPVIVSENTGSKDAVLKGGGFVVPVDDTAALKEKILFFYEDRKRVEQYGRRAYEVAQSYTWKNYYAQLENAITQIWKREHAGVS